MTISQAYYRALGIADQQLGEWDGVDVDTIARRLQMDPRDVKVALIGWRWLQITARSDKEVEERVA